MVLALVCAGTRLSMTLLCSTYLWSIGVMEYWKNENPTSTLCSFKRRSWRIYDAWSSQAIDHHSSTPILHHSMKLLRVEPIFSDLTQRTKIPKFD
jgi:hypothetical protein